MTTIGRRAASKYVWRFRPSADPDRYFGESECDCTAYRRLP